MRFRGSLAGIALTIALFAPSHLVAQVSPPQGSVSDGIEADLLDHIWCRQVFVHESISRDAEGDAALSGHYAFAAMGMGGDVMTRFLEAGHTQTMLDILVSFYRITLASMSESRPEAYRDALGACESAFSRTPAPVTAEPAQPTVPGLEDGIAAFRARDYATALRILRPHAEDGIAEAQYHLGEMYDYGQGVEQDRAEALRWYGLAANQDHAPGLMALGMAYYIGNGVRQDGFVAVRLFVEAADLGYTPAQYMAATIFETGDGGGPVDHADAEKYYRLAAEGGHANAQFSLGNLYESGVILERDEAEAARWYRLAVERGNSLAHYRLALLHMDGRGVPQDFDEAARLLEYVSGTAWGREAIDRLNRMRAGN